MDPVSHALLGASASQSVFQGQLKLRIWLIGIFAGMAPDLDILIRSATNPLLFIKYHRHFTHSLTFIPIGGLLVGLFICLVLPRAREHWRIVLMTATIAFATHGILDCCTSYGTVLLWPFSEKRIAWDIISIVDPIFTSILLFGVIISVYNNSRLSAIITLSLILSYLSFGYYQHSRAKHLQLKIAAKRHHHIERGRVTPELGQLFAWNSFYVYQHKIYLDTISIPILKYESYTENTIIDEFNNDDLAEDIKQNKMLYNDYKIFSWFTDNYIIKLSTNPLILGDARYLINRQKPVQSLWGIEFPQDHRNDSHIKWCDRITQEIESSQ